MAFIGLENTVINFSRYDRRLKIKSPNGRSVSGAHPHNSFVLVFGYPDYTQDADCNALNVRNQGEPIDLIFVLNPADTRKHTMAEALNTQSCINGRIVLPS